MFVGPLLPGRCGSATAMRSSLAGKDTACLGRTVEPKLFNFLENMQMMVSFWMSSYQSFSVEWHFSFTNSLGSHHGIRNVYKHQVFKQFSQIYFSSTSTLPLSGYLPIPQARHSHIHSCNIAASNLSLRTHAFYIYGTNIHSMAQAIWSLILFSGPLVKFIPSVSSGGSRIFPRGGTNSQNCYYFSHFCRKLHENERIWTPRGGARVPGAPLGSANGQECPPESMAPLPPPPGTCKNKSQKRWLPKATAYISCFLPPFPLTRRPYISQCWSSIYNEQERSS